MRGKVATTASVKTSCGITPAYAGKRAGVYTRYRAHEDHPRLCGEKLSKSLYNMPKMGSPPPMRGKVLNESGQTAASRITPAYAGKRAEFQHEPNGFEDHPRLCGEK